MPHHRSRWALERIKNRLKHTPVVAIQGARQTGKSFLARDLLAPTLKSAAYVTLDSPSLLEFCKSAPESFLAKYEDKHPLIIDEAQKAAVLFNVIKFKVDPKRIPGQFLLLGSTEFSHLQDIRESLTGRLGRVRLLPMVYREIYGKIKSTLTPSRKEFLEYSEKGGMPALCFTRDPVARREQCEDWVKLTCERDIHQFKKGKFDSELAYSLLRHSALLEEPTQAHLARATGANSMKVSAHLKALVELFVLNRLDPHPSGKGKSIYLPLDAGIANYFGATLTRRLHILILNERLALNSYETGVACQYYFYRSTGRSLIHLVEEGTARSTHAFQISEKTQLNKVDLALLKAFQSKNEGAKLTWLSATTESFLLEKTQVRPWEACLG